MIIGNGNEENNSQIHSRNVRQKQNDVQHYKQDNCHY
jgi:hypothetical protein